MGGHAGRGGGESPLSADLPIWSMGGRAGQVGGGPSARAARMLDDGHEARAEAKKTSAVELGEVDRAMRANGHAGFFNREAVRTDGRPD
jgi:hypothetical protein